jgi:hypothetical protein
VRGIRVDLRAGVGTENILDRVTGFPLRETDRTTYPLLAGVDPYSTTFFGQLQMGWLAEELGWFAATFDGPERDVVSRVADLAREGSGKPHHYLVFRGD